MGKGGFSGSVNPHRRRLPLECHVCSLFLNEISRYATDWKVILTKEQWVRLLKGCRRALCGPTLDVSFDVASGKRPLSPSYGNLFDHHDIPCIVDTGCRKCQLRHCSMRELVKSTVYPHEL